jgi:hypothetical protein
VPVSWSGSPCGGGSECLRRIAPRGNLWPWDLRDSDCRATANCTGKLSTLLHATV